jgi:hypothetical protein
MASTLNQDIGAFLDETVSTLTDLHVKAAQYAGQPDVQAAFGDLAQVPGALIERAQQLRARLDDEAGESEAEKPKAKAKPSTSKH